MTPVEIRIGQVYSYIIDELDFRGTRKWRFLSSRVGRSRTLLRGRTIVMSGSFLRVPPVTFYGRLEEQTNVFVLIFHTNDTGAPCTSWPSAVAKQNGIRRQYRRRFRRNTRPRVNGKWRAREIIVLRWERTLLLLSRRVSLRALTRQKPWRHVWKKKVNYHRIRYYRAIHHVTVFSRLSTVYTGQFTLFCKITRVLCLFAGSTGRSHWVDASEVACPFIFSRRRAKRAFAESADIRIIIKTGNIG